MAKSGKRNAAVRKRARTAKRDRWAALKPGWGTWSRWSIASWATAAVGWATLLASRPWVSSPLTGWTVAAVLSSLDQLARVVADRAKHLTGCYRRVQAQTFHQKSLGSDGLQAFVHIT